MALCNRVVSLLRYPVSYYRVWLTGIGLKAIPYNAFLNIARGSMLFPVVHFGGCVVVDLDVRIGVEVKICEIEKLGPWITKDIVTAKVSLFCRLKSTRPQKISLCTRLSSFDCSNLHAQSKHTSLNLLNKKLLPLGLILDVNQCFMARSLRARISMPKHLKSITWQFLNFR